MGALKVGRGHVLAADPFVEANIINAIKSLENISYVRIDEDGIRDSGDLKGNYYFILDDERFAETPYNFLITTLEGLRQQYPNDNWSVDFAWDCAAWEAAGVIQANADGVKHTQACNAIASENASYGFQKSVTGYCIKHHKFHNEFQQVFRWKRSL